MEEDRLFESRVDLSQLKESVEAIRQEIGKIIVGQQKMVDLLITAMLADGHVLIEGVPGVAKTLTAKLMSKVVSVDFSRIQFTPDLMPSDILGTSIFNQKNAEFEFKSGPIFTNIALIDEINRAPAKTQAALFEVMEEKQVSIDGVTHKMGFPFMVIATQNPIDQEGTYRLPEAQLDRFLFKINVDYPSMQDEVSILTGHHARKNVNDINTIKSLLSKEQLQAYRENVQSLHVEEKLFTYIAAIVNETRNNGGLYLGGSPRASLAILSSAKAFAAIQGRDFVTPEDIKEVALPVLRHRVILTPEKELEGSSASEVVQHIIDKVEVPR